MSVVFYHGVPFKYNKVIRDHSRFVHTVKFSPNGDLFASAGADGKVQGKNTYIRHSVLCGSFVKKKPFVNLDLLVRRKDR